MEYKTFIYKRVQVRSMSRASEYGDEGVLRQMDPHFVVIENDKGETYIFPTQNIRLIKVLERNPVSQ